MFLFCYGSLEFAEVMREVTGRTFAGEPAVLDGFARYRVRDADYPGLLPESGACTRGTLYREVDDTALAALDRFEGPLYERRWLEVRVADGARPHASVYVVREAQRDLLTREPWDERAFARDRLEAFLRRIRID
ncbi:MAG: gamma-glutamylcyclotransferase [Deltaproteobacteria bacterium]|nr:gamma-glutamylcyclotransferase [Deltaproteobacteria bacterium]